MFHLEVVTEPLVKVWELRPAAIHRLRVQDMADMGDLEIEQLPNWGIPTEVSMFHWQLVVEAEMYMGLETV
jgi:hypothetical protein